MDFKYIKNISNEEGVILIYKEIGTTVDKYGNISYGINGAEFGAEMLYLQNVCKNITVRINSIGGSVLDGYAIASSILNSKVPVTTIIDGLAASTALWCAAAGAKGQRKCMDYATGMIHGSTGAEDKQLQDLVDTSINTILSNRSNKNVEEIKSMMSTETWLNAGDLLKGGFVDEVVSTGKKIKSSKNLANMANVYNNLINPKMSNINKLLKLANNAEVEEQETAIAGLTKEVADKNAELEAVKNELKALKDANEAREKEAKEALRNRATEMVNKFEKEGKLSKDEVASTIENASKDEASFTFVSNLLSKVGNSKESKKPFRVENVAGDDRSKWTYNDWEKKDLEGLTNMYKTDKEQFNELVKTRKVQK